MQWNGEYVEPPEPVSWFPEKLAWSMRTPKQVIRKFAPFASFQKFLVSETGVGNISRQEVVSMIPPLLMDIKPGMTVLDMCAAPGSKSAQLIEMIHMGEETRVRKALHDIGKEGKRLTIPDGIGVGSDNTQTDVQGDWSDDGRSTGLLIANDSDYKRAQMLVHQVKRLNSPNLIVTNHDASQFPSIRIPSHNPRPRYLKFDRILADVPCSGDGTARKNYTVWKDWVPGNALGLHSLQVRILVRAIQMLKVGGRAVYSTCSLNPVENEAVVATAIEICGGPERVRIVDCSNDLPGLKRTSGLKSWKVMDKKGKLWDSWSNVEEALNLENSVEHDHLSRLTEGMFPRLNQVEGIQLERGIRIYPHFQDTGGFFITVLEKLSEIKAHIPKVDIAKEEKKDQITPNAAIAVNGQGTEDSAENAELDLNGHADISPNDSTLDKLGEDESRKRAVEDDSEMQDRLSKINKTDVDAPTSAAAATISTRNSMPTGKSRNNAPQEEFYKYLEPTHPTLQEVFTFYDISPRFPRDRYMVRNVLGEPVKAIYYTSVIVRDILTLNEGKGIKFIQAGVKMFMKQDAQGQDICRWRIQSEGIPIIDPWVGEGRAIIIYKRETMKKLLKEMFIKISNGLHEDLGEIGEQVRDLSMGCAVLRIESSDAEDGFK